MRKIMFAVLLLICTGCSETESGVSESNKNIAVQVISITDEFLDGAVTAREARNYIFHLGELDTDGASENARLAGEVELLRHTLSLLTLGDRYTEINPEILQEYTVIIDIRNRIAIAVEESER